jgi:hypothetical protein
MRSLFPVLLAAALLTSVASAKPAATHDPAAILRVAKAAAGGAALDKLTGSYEQGEHGGNRYTTWLNFQRYGMRNENTRNGVTRTTGFNGKVFWQVGPDGAVTIKDDPASLREAITTAYVSNTGYFYPDRFPARLRYLGEEHAGGRVFDAIETEPQGGRPFQLWFDRKTHQLARVVDDGGDPATWVEATDLRKMGPGLVASRLVIHRMADGKVLDVGEVGSVEYRDVPASTFDPPARP